MMNPEPLRKLFDVAGFNDRFYGVVVGIVTNNQDPDNMHRVKVRFPWLNQDHESNWARVATSMAGNGRGAYFLPEVDDEVLVAFEHGLIDQPYIIGSLWNGKDLPPESNQNGKNNHRTFKSRSGHIIRFNDEDGRETIEIIDKTGNNKIVIDSAKNTVTIEANSDIEIKSAAGKLTLSAIGIELNSKAGVQIEASTTVDLKANAQVTVKGAIINLN
ncbi:MAG: phage baseplate assembly protein V [Methylococcales bacterium]|nr:phage baseplate assembly protein V [Methylococcales bacterium]